MTEASMMVRNSNHNRCNSVSVLGVIRDVVYQQIWAPSVGDKAMSLWGIAWDNKINAVAGW